MRRISLLIALAVVALSLSLAGTAAAKPGNGNGNGQGNKPARARITWSVARVDQTVAPGETVQVPVTLTSSADLSNVTLAAPGGLGKIASFSPASIAALQAGVPQSVTLTITMPAEGAHCQGGVVKVRAGNRSVPAPLKVKVLLPGGCGE